MDEVQPAESRRWWDRLAVHVADQYTPHLSDFGVFLFREKLRRRRFREEMALRLDPGLVARAVPWAGFLKFGGNDYLHLATYQRTPRWQHATFDQRFELHLAVCVAGSERGMNEIFLITRLSPARFAALEAGEVELYDAYRLAEDGQVLRAGPMDSPIVIPCSALRDEDLPPRGRHVRP